MHSAYLNMAGALELLLFKTNVTQFPAIFESGLFEKK